MNSSGFGSQGFGTLFKRFRFQRGLLFGMLIIAALLAFEIFNYSTTDYALADLLGDLTFIGIRWSTILAIAFCGIDFAGIARLFTPEEGANEPTEVWYLFGAWMLAATMNAMLTWWGVSLAILGHQTLGNAVIERQTLLRIVPIFVAIMVWLIRVLIIGTFSVAGDRLFTQSSTRASIGNPLANVKAARTIKNNPIASTPLSRPASSTSASTPTPAASPSFRPAQRTTQQQESGYTRQPETNHPPRQERQEPTYHSLSMSPSENGRNQSSRK
jgi:hypothetical protein